MRLATKVAVVTGAGSGFGTEICRRFVREGARVVLVDRRREAEFDAEVKAIGQRHENLNIRYTGPWPPYNFVNIRLKLERSTGG